MCNQEQPLPQPMKNIEQPSDSPAPSEAEIVNRMLQDFRAFAPDVPEFTLLCKGIASNQPTEARLKQYLEGLAAVLGMDITIPAESWTTASGLMAAIALNDSSPLVNTWGNVFKVNVDSREPFCIRDVVNYTRSFFQAESIVFLPL